MNSFELNKSDWEVDGHVQLPAKPIPESCPDMWFHIVSEIKINQRIVRGQSNSLQYEPAMTFTPAAWQLLIMFAYWARVPRLDVRMYETG